MAVDTSISIVFIGDISQFSLSSPFDSSGFCDISNTLVYQTQVAYLSGVCFMSGIIANTECAVVKSIAVDLRMIVVNNTAYNNTLSGTCCTGVGISCDANNHTTGINWSGMALNGTLVTTKIELLYSYLQSFNISNNFVNGTFSPGFTSNVVSLDLSENKLKGSLFSVRLNKLTSLNLANNLFNGKILKLPPNLITLILSNNGFTKLPATPYSVLTFDISFNNITGGVHLNSKTVVKIQNNLVSDISFVTNNTLIYYSLQRNSLVGINYPLICLLFEEDITSIHSISTRTSQTSISSSLSALILSHTSKSSITWTSLKGNHAVTYTNGIQSSTLLVGAESLNSFIRNETLINTLNW